MPIADGDVHSIAAVSTASKRSATRSESSRNTAARMTTSPSAELDGVRTEVEQHLGSPKRSLRPRRQAERWSRRRCSPVRPGSTGLPTSGRSAGAFAEPFARLVDLAPRPADAHDLHPSPAWTAWSDQEGGLWPWPDDRDIDLNAVDGPPWVDDAGRHARDRLRAGVTEVVIGHGDWYAGNLRFRGDRLIVAHDWDSVITESEAVLVGFAAAVYPTLNAGDESTIAETEDFLAAYTKARGRAFTAEDVECSWAAGVWQRAFEAKKQHASNEPVRSLTEREARDRLRLAGTI